jgi:hypothetical protein
VFEKIRTRVAVLEIMKDDLVAVALHDPMDSGRANNSAWGQMAGVIMRFSTNPAYRVFQPPIGLSPCQRAIWIVHAFSKVVAASSPQPQLAMALNVAVSSYAERKRESAIADQAQIAVARLLTAESGNSICYEYYRRYRITMERHGAGWRAVIRSPDSVSSISGPTNNDPTSYKAVLAEAKILIDRGMV